MNIVGKTLIVLQLFLSLLFVCFAGAVYHFQGEWRQKVNQAEDQVRQLQQSLDDEISSAATKLGEANALRVAAEQERDTLLTELDGAKQRADTADSLMAEFRQSRDKAIAENEKSTDEAASRLAEAKALRREVQTLREQNAAQLEQIRETENDNLDNSGKLVEARLAEERNLKLIARLKNLLRASGIDPGTRVAGDVSEAVEKVDGYVMARHRNRSRTQEFIQTTIGSDDQVQKDTVLTVYRGNKYVCDVRIIDVQSDSSVGLVIEDSRNSNVQEGDRVTTKL